MITDFSQCDEAMIKKLEGLQVEDSEGNLVNVPVVYIDPEVEFKASILPTIAIYRAGIYPDNYRWTNDKFYDNPQYDPATGDLVAVDERDAPDPFNAYYGIRMYYEYQMDGVVLNKHILSELRRGAFAEINGDFYDIIFVSYKNPDATYKTFGEVKENEQREFVEQYLYRIQIELDNAMRKQVKVSQGLIPRITVNP